MTRTKGKANRGLSAVSQASKQQFKSKNRLQSNKPIQSNPSKTNRLQSPKRVQSNQPNTYTNRLQSPKGVQSNRPNTFINRRWNPEPSTIGGTRRGVDLNATASVEYLHFKEEVSNYGHLSDSPLPLTPWYSLEEFEEIMETIFDSVFESPKRLPPFVVPERQYEFYVKKEDKQKIIDARSKVRTWKVRSRNIHDAQFLTEFIICLERLLDYLLAKSFQRKRLGVALYGMKTMVITGFITSLESTLTKQVYSFLGRSMKASKLFSCPKWILQIRHTLSHSNTQLSDDTLEDAISFILAWFRGNFEFHLKKMPSDSYAEDKEFYQHRSFSNSNFNYKTFNESLVDLFYGKLGAEEEEVFLNDVRHFSRFDLNKFLCFLVNVIDRIMIAKKDKPSFDFFMPPLRKMKGIFQDTRTDIFCLKFLNKLLDQVIKYEQAIEKTDQTKTDNLLLFAKGRDRLYNFMYMFVRTIIGKNTETKEKFFHIYLTDRLSDSVRWSKFSFRLLCEVKHFFPETVKLVIYIFKSSGDVFLPKQLKTDIAKKLIAKRNEHQGANKENAKEKKEDSPKTVNAGDNIDDDHENNVLYIVE